MSKHKRTVVCGESPIAVDVLEVLRLADDSNPGTAAACDVMLTAADEIERLRRKCNRLLLRGRMLEQERHGLRALCVGLIDAIKDLGAGGNKQCSH
jgi:hypothetical protein